MIEFPPLHAPDQPLYGQDEDLPEFRRIDPHFETIIGFIEPPLTRIIRQLRPNLQARKYDILICEGNSAIIPASIIHGVASRVYHANYHDPLTTFRTEAGSQADDDLLDGEIARAVKNGILTPGMSALTITDCIDSGACVERIVKRLDDNGINSDVTALSLWNTVKDIRASNPGIPYSTGIFYGDRNVHQATCRSGFLTPSTTFGPTPNPTTNEFVVSLKEAASRDIIRMATKLYSNFQ